MEPSSFLGAPRAVKFLCGPAFPDASDSNFRSISHKDVELGNLSVRRWFGIPCHSAGSCNATETAEADRDSTTSSSFAPAERPECRRLRERSRDLLLFLFDQPG